MTINCPACGTANLDDAEFCDSCGYELTNITPAPPPISGGTSPTPVYVPPAPTPVVSIPTSANFASSCRLISKSPGSPTNEFPINGAAVIGIFDSDSGPVDVDLEAFPGGETVSRQHGEIYQEAGTWKIKDLGSTNGIFIKRAGQARYGARITMPEILNNGDEIAVAKVRFLFQTP